MSTGTSTFSETIVSPKQNAITLRGRASWYPYYAGYSPAFVREMLTRLSCQQSTVVLDPWNGGGTTSQVATDMGFSAIGFDVNPVMAIVASARVLSKSEVAVLQSAVAQIARRTKAFRAKTISSEDPLLAWMDENSAQAARHLERAILDCLGLSAPPVLSSHEDSISSTVAFLYTALFRTLRSLAGQFRPSNPTWLKVPPPHGRIVISTSDLVAEFQATATEMLEAFQEELALDAMAMRKKSRIAVCSSTKLPLTTASVDVVISSPPYCTRIDYAVSTRLELAVLRGATSFRELRNQMIGTSTIRAECPELKPEWGNVCLRLLHAIQNHSSRASKSYYYKNHAQYFDDIFRSLSEINKCLRRGGHCVLVVQDSFYKDVHNDLPLIVEEMASALGWLRADRYDFPVSRTMAGVNTRSRQYSKNRAATESILWFTSAKS